VLGQLRRALELATEEQTAGPEITELFQRAIASGRRVRIETPIARGSTSFAQASVLMATDDLGVDLDGAEVVIIGAPVNWRAVSRGRCWCAPAPSSNDDLYRTTAHGERLRDELSDPRVAVATLDDVTSLITTGAWSCRCRSLVPGHYPRRSRAM